MRRGWPRRHTALLERTRRGQGRSRSGGSVAADNEAVALAENAVTEGRSRSGRIVATDNATVALAEKTDTKGSKQEPWYMTLRFLARVLSVLVILECAVAFAFEWSHKHWLTVDVGTPLPSLPEQRRAPLQRIFAGFPCLMKPYFSDASCVKGRICVVAILALSLLNLFFGFVHNLWQKEWWDLFNQSDSDRFPRLMGTFGLLVTAWILSQVYLGYMRSWLYIDWREHMTRQFTQGWLASHAHFLMQLGDGVDNPDQRLQEDIHLFVDNAITICPEFLSSLGNLFVFVPIVLSLEPSKAFGVVHFPGWLLCLAALYSAFGNLSTHVIGWPMMNLSFARQRYEADFRHLALHVRDRAESVALYSSEPTEEACLHQQFERIKLVQWRQMILTKRLTFFTSAYEFVQFLAPFFILAPSYFRKDLSLGDLFQLTGAIGTVAGSLDWFLRVYGSLAEWRATADRLLSFQAAISVAQKQAAEAVSGLRCSGRRSTGAVPSGAGGKQPRQGKPSSAAVAAHSSGDEGGECSGWLQAEIDEVHLPNGEILWKDIRLELRRGQSALISGPEGTGKSVLFKALAGVWPHVVGSKVRLPVEDPRQVLFVPQRPALPKRCSLGDALSYPELGGSYTEEALHQALRDVKLDQLLKEDPVGDCDGPFLTNSAVGLDRVEDWGSRLSPGQQQRLAIGHVLLRLPRVLFLDEATSSVGKEGAVQLYLAVTQRLPKGAVVVSISHDVDVLEPLHDVHLTAVGGGPKELRVLKGPGIAGGEAAGLSQQLAPALALEKESS